MKPGPLRCRIVVRDLDTGRSAVGSTTAHIAKPVASGLVLFTPLLITSHGGLRRVDGAALGKSETVSWREIYAYDPSRYSPVVGDEPVDAGTVVAIVPLSTAVAGELDVAFSANLIDSGNGQNIPASLAPAGRHKQGSIDVAFLEVQLAQVPAGKYVLYINAVDKASGAAAHAHVLLVVARRGPRLSDTRIDSFR